MFRTQILITKPLPTTLQYSEPLLSLLRFSTRKFRYLHGNGLAVLIDSVGLLGDSFSCDYMLLPTIEALHEMSGVGVARCFRGFASTGLADDMLRKHFLKNYLRRQNLTVSTLSIFVEGLNLGFEHAIAELVTHPEQLSNPSTTAGVGFERQSMRGKRAMSAKVSRERAKYLESIQMLLIAAHRQCLSESNDSFFLPEECAEALLFSTITDPSVSSIDHHTNLSATLALLHALPKELFGHPSTDYVVDVLLSAVSQSAVLTLDQLFTLSDALIFKLGPRLRDKLQRVIAPRVLQQTTISIVRNSPKFLLSILRAYAPWSENDHHVAPKAGEASLENVGSQGHGYSFELRQKIFQFFSNIAKRWYLDRSGDGGSSNQQGSGLEFVGVLGQTKVLHWMPELTMEVLKQASQIVYAELSSRHVAYPNLAVFIDKYKASTSGMRQDSTTILHLRSWQLSEYIQLIEVLVHLSAQPDPQEGCPDSSPLTIDTKWVHDLLFAALNLVERLLWEEPLGVAMLLRLVTCLHELTVARQDEVSRNRSRRVKMMTSGNLAGTGEETTANGAASDSADVDSSTAQPKARILHYKLVAAVDQSISRATRNLQLWEAVELFILHVRYAPSSRGTHSLAQKIISEGAKLHGEEVGKLIRALKHYPLATNFLDKLIPHMKPALIHSMDHMDVVCLLTQLATVFGPSRHGDPDPGDQDENALTKARYEANPLPGSELEGTLKQFVALHVAELELLPALSCLLAAGRLRLGYSSAFTDQGSLLFDVLQGKLVPTGSASVPLPQDITPFPKPEKEGRKRQRSRRGNGRRKGKELETSSRQQNMHIQNDDYGGEPKSWQERNSTDLSTSVQMTFNVLEMAAREAGAGPNSSSPSPLSSLALTQNDVGTMGTVGSVVDVRFIQLIHQELHRLIEQVPPPSMHLMVRVTAALSSSHIPRPSLLLLLRTITARPKSRVNHPQRGGRHSANDDPRRIKEATVRSNMGPTAPIVYPSLEFIQNPTDLLTLFFDLVQLLTDATTLTRGGSDDQKNSLDDEVPLSIFSYLSVVVIRLGDLAKAQELKVDPMLEIYAGLLRAQNIWLTQSWSGEVTSPIEESMQPFLKSVLTVSVKFPQRWTSSNIMKGFHLLLIDAKLTIASTMVRQQEPTEGPSPSGPLSDSFVESRMPMLNALTYLTFHSLKLGWFRSNTTTASNLNPKSRRNLFDDESLTLKQIQHLKESILPELVSLGLPEAERLLHVLRKDSGLEQKLADILEFSGDTAADGTVGHH
jgi:hypothetical protein